MQNMSLIESMRIVNSLVEDEQDPVTSVTHTSLVSRLKMCFSPRSQWSPR